MHPFYLSPFDSAYHRFHCSILAPRGVSPCSGSQEYCVNNSHGISGHSPQCTMPLSWQHTATGHSPWNGRPFVSIQPPQPQVSLYLHLVQCNPQRESTILFIIFVRKSLIYAVISLWYLSFKASLQKSPSQPHLHAVLAPPCRSFSPTFTH